MTLTETLDLRGGRTCWRADDSNPLVSDPLPGAPVDVAIVGAGVMGAMLADRLSAAGRSVALLDRRPPAHGATAASTALVMWA
ncbi:FAD-dependent oxidoreductase, partial [Phenylobacterium sp.]|uniref:FAD-dependent oxidoreductase n=1 Tax=Phenylobacterium sp. TaxID=1871053 RepID=UPI00286C647D